MIVQASHMSNTSINLIVPLIDILLQAALGALDAFCFLMW